MTSFIRLLILFVIAISCFNLSAKETICYKLTESSDPSIKIGGCQFITFIADKCYESTSSGFMIHSGALYKNPYLSSSNTIVYTGQCFCGSRAKLKFSKDKTSLMIISHDGHSFRFTKIAPPKDIKTCAYVMEDETSPNSNNYIEYNSGPNPTPNYNSSSSSYNNSTSNSPNSNSSSSRKFKCAYCNGTGMVEKNDNAPASFGQNRPRQQCPTCGKWYDPTVFTHYHQQCRHCGGTGYTK